MVRGYRREGVVNEGGETGWRRLITPHLPLFCPDTGTVSLASRTEVVNSLCDTVNKNPPVVLGE